MRALLNQEIPMAAEAIRTLTGPIKIRQEPIPGRDGRVDRHVQPGFHRGACVPGQGQTGDSGWS